MPPRPSFGKRTSPLPPDGVTLAQWQALASLPIQTGLWIAHLDPGGAPHAEPREMESIPAFLDKAAHKFMNIPLIAHIARVARAEWGKGTGHPLTEEALFAKAQEILTSLSTVTTSLECNAYKLLLIEMAEHVARAAPDREAGAYNLMNGPSDGWYGLYPAFLNQTVRQGRGPQVSRLEKEGMNRLIDAIDAAHMVKKWDLGSPDTGPGVRVYDSTPLTQKDAQTA